MPESTDINIKEEIKDESMQVEEITEDEEKATLIKKEALKAEEFTEPAASSTDINIKEEIKDESMKEQAIAEDEEKATLIKSEALKAEEITEPAASIKEEIKVVDKDEVVTKITSLETLDKYIASKDNSQNVIYMQDIPDVCKQQPCMLGVDEAGRGPVLGPMVYGIAFCPLENKQALIDLGCADSKQLTEEKREVIFEQMHTETYANSCIGWAVELISPNTISTSMNRRTKYSLNEVSMGSAIGLIHCAIDSGVNIAEVYVDTVGPPEKYEEKLKGIFPQFKITVAKKADSTYPIVSAASICAKVTRDHALKVWKFQEGLIIKDNNFGSGYPGDPVTKRFLTDNIDMVFGYPRLVRFSWSTAENALADKAYNMEFDQPESEKPKYAGTKLTKFFKGTTKTGEVKRQQCRFFKERFLNTVVDI